MSVTLHSGLLTEFTVGLRDLIFSLMNEQINYHIIVPSSRQQSALQTSPQQQNIIRQQNVPWTNLLTMGIDNIKFVIIWYEYGELSSLWHSCQKIMLNNTFKVSLLTSSESLSVVLNIYWEGAGIDNCSHFIVLIVYLSKLDKSRSSLDLWQY